VIFRSEVRPNDPSMFGDAPPFPFLQRNQRLLPLPWILSSKIVILFTFHHCLNCVTSFLFSGAAVLFSPFSFFFRSTPFLHSKRRGCSRRWPQTGRILVQQWMDRPSLTPLFPRTNKRVAVLRRLLLPLSLGLISFALRSPPSFRPPPALAETVPCSPPMQFFFPALVHLILLFFACFQFRFLFLFFLHASREDSPPVPVRVF